MNLIPSLGHSRPRNNPRHSLNSRGGRRGMITCWRGRARGCGHGCVPPSWARPDWVNLGSGIGWRGLEPCLAELITRWAAGEVVTPLSTRVETPRVVTWREPQWWAKGVYGALWGSPFPSPYCGTEFLSWGVPTLLLFSLNFSFPSRPALHTTPRLSCVHVKKSC